MAFNTFTPPKEPSSPLTDEPEFRIANAEFGDGYEQRAPKGINWKRSVISVAWRNIARSEADTILQFFYDQDFNPFYYTLPYENSQRKWVATEWSREDRVDGFVDVQATWRESFELDS